MHEALTPAQVERAREFEELSNDSFDNANGLDMLAAVVGSNTKDMDQLVALMKQDNGSTPLGCLLSAILRDWADEEAEAAQS